jgi:hypothetical protein
MRLLKISVFAKDAFKFDTDVLVLKYAQSLYGVDRAAVELFSESGVTFNLPKIADFTFQKTSGLVGLTGPGAILFVGVKPLAQFSYSEIRDFSRTALDFLARMAPDTRSLALTLHGTGYGLDEAEAFDSELAGLLDAISAGHFPPNLETITFVELDSRRAQRLTESLEKLLPRGHVVLDGGRIVTGIDERAQHTLRDAGYASSSKPHVFVAMPAAQEMDDVFYYGIRGAINAAGLLCERADFSPFTGDVLSRIKMRISSAILVVADLSSANPNVYLEVGYAWGCRVPTVLVARDASELKFDVRGQRCLIYKSIRNLEDLLRDELGEVLRQ